LSQFDSPTPAFGDLRISREPRGLELWDRGLHLPDDSWTLEVAIPFKAYRQSLPNVFPKPGDVWRLNLNRCGGKTNEQFSQWAPGTEKMPQFHTPRDFGFVHFSADRMPF
jgi:Carbohydrate-binding family 9